MKSLKTKKILNNIVNKLEDESIKRKYDETIKLMMEIEEFIKKKKLMLYGGYALNLLLSKKNKIYNEKNMNDIDCYSKSAQSDSYELADILYKKGYEYIQVKKAMHENTFRVYVNFIQILDITNIDSELYDKLFEITLKERTQKKTIYKYYNRYDIYIVPFLLLKRNLYFELARPKSSYYRWEKIYPRLNILTNNIKIKVNNKKKIFIKTPNEYKKIFKIVLNYIKKNKYPIVGSFPLKFFKNINNNYCCRLNNISNQFTIYSIDYDKTKDEIKNIIKNNIDTNKYIIYDNEITYLPDIISKIYRISIKNIETNNDINIINIINLENECISIKKIKGYTICSIDTILYYYYSIYIICIIYSNNNIEETLLIIQEYEKILKNMNIKNRLSTMCYGNYITKQDILKKQWMKKKEIYYPVNKKN